MKKFLHFTLIVLLVTSFINVKEIKAAPAPHLVISEIQTTGGTGYTMNEFVELYNPTESDFDLSGWKLTKKTASGKEYVLIDNFGEKSVKSHSFFLVAHPAGYTGSVLPDSYYTTTNSLADSNTVILYDNAGQVIDKVGFGTTIDFESEAASNPGAKKSIERKAKQESMEETMVEGGNDYFLGNSDDTDNNKQDFILRESSEPQNSLSEPEYLTIDIPEIPKPPEDIEEPKDKVPETEEPKDDELPTQEPIIYSDKIIISEFLPNPEGVDDNEFIELKNIGKEDVNLVGWKLGDNSSRIYTVKPDDFDTTVVKASKSFVIYKEISKISLNNTFDSVKLYQPDDNLLDEVEYADCQEGQSYNLIDGSWFWSSEITSGEENIFVVKNEPPEAEMDFPEEAKVGEDIIFDASESSDLDEDKLDYYWDFGDGNSGEGVETEHSYQKAGIYKVILCVADGKDAEAEIDGEIKITSYDFSDKIVINELLPAPEGNDKDLEWIELYNQGNSDVNLENWQLTDLKTYYKFPKEKIIKAGDYLVIQRKESKISLNDAGDKLFLIDPAEKVINGVEYQKAKKDLAYARQNGTDNWSWTEEPTPDGENEIALSEEDSEDINETENTQQKTKEDTEGENAEVTEKNVATNTVPIELKISDVNEDYLKKLITVTGEVDRTSGNNIYLIDEEGNNLRAYIQAKTGIKKPELKQGDKLKITGVLDKTTAGLRLLPRKQEDIVVVSNETAEGGKVLGTTDEKKITELPESSTNQDTKKYLLVAAVALVLVLAGLGVKYYLKKKQEN